MVPEVPPVSCPYIIQPHVTKSHYSRNFNPTASQFIAQKKSQAYITTIIPSSTGPGLLSAREKPLLENPSSGKNKHTCVKSDSAR